VRGHFSTTGWNDLARRTFREFLADDCLGLAAQLAYYFFLSLFPALLFLLALASFFSLGDVAERLVPSMGSVVPPDVLAITREQIQRISDANHSGLLTIGFLGALWSSSAAIVSIIDSLNRAYDVNETRPWWRVRLVALSLTVALASLVLIAFALVLAGPTVAEYLADIYQLGAVFEWTWKVAQWPIAVLLVSAGVGLVYYAGPDIDQRWSSVAPGAILATILWLVASLGCKFYVTNFTDYNAVYGTVGGVIVLLLWFYVSGLAVLMGAELNAELEHSLAPDPAATHATRAIASR
jgi:membrane protein